MAEVLAEDEKSHATESPTLYYGTCTHTSYMLKVREI